ncbi:hypothetical protein ABZS76_32910 [Streptomyces sp. NPDC005562]|uniref:hypothetical protein n=1 Tax=Streptomyces sp. NPDC005562 TaxID=3154890 RepID=UPI0033BB843D
MTMREHDSGEPLYLNEQTYGDLLDVVQGEVDSRERILRLLDAAHGTADSRERMLRSILVTIGIAPPPGDAYKGLCPVLYCDESGDWTQCRKSPGHPVTELHTGPKDLLGERREWSDGHLRSLVARNFSDQTPPVREYFYCGATIDPDDGPTYTCNRRVAHKGQCSPDHDED